VASKIVKADCPKCKYPQKTRILAEAKDKLEPREYDDGLKIWELDEFRILKCSACRTVFFERADYQVSKDEWGNEEKEFHNAVYWPEFREKRRELPPWLAEIELPHVQQGNLMGVLRDTYALFNQGGFDFFAAIGIRTVFDIASAHLDIDPEKPVDPVKPVDPEKPLDPEKRPTFRQKIEKLRKSGKISEDDERRLDQLIWCGSESAHRGWTPSEDQLNVMFLGLENFLHTNFYVRDKFSKTKFPSTRRRKDESKG